MIQIEDEVYSKMKKDADDNKQIVRIIRTVAAVIIFCILFFTWGTRLIDLDIQRRTDEMRSAVAVEQAKTNKQILSIESEGLTMDEYLKWLSVREDKQ